MISAPQLQMGVVQVESADTFGGLPLGISNTVPLPHLLSGKEVLVRVLAVALNPIDFKIVTKYPDSNRNVAIGCDFCGIVEDGPAEALIRFPRGTRVCGGVFPYGASGSNIDLEQSSEDREDVPKSDRSGQCRVGGAFSEWLSVDSNFLLRVPSAWKDIEAAAFGCACWSAAVLALFVDPEGLALDKTPSNPMKTCDDRGKIPVLVYGGATATGTMACQLLKLSGYFTIAVVSEASASVSRAYGADETVSYLSSEHVATIKRLADRPIRHVLDCITSQDSVKACFASIGRAGGRYACLENLEESLRTRRAVHTKEIMGFELLGRHVDLGGPTSVYSRGPNPGFREQGVKWVSELQKLIDQGRLKAHPVEEISVGKGHRWCEGVIEGLATLQRGEVRAKKLVVKLPQHHND